MIVIMIMIMIMIMNNNGHCKIQGKTKGDDEMMKARTFEGVYNFLKILKEIRLFSLNILAF
jgi:hypothetical protein